MAADGDGSPERATGVIAPTTTTADAAAAECPRRSSRVGAAIDTLVVGFAAWTLVYYLALIVGTPLSGTVALRAALLLVVAAMVLWHVLSYRRGRGPEAGPRAPAPDREPRPPTAVLVTALAAAALSLIANRPDADDVFYVNRSSAVSQRGELPLRDTMFSDEAFAMIFSQFPPVASLEALLGVIAGPFGTSAADITYYLVPPLASAGAVLAVWRLIASWALRWPQAAFAIAMVYLLWGGAFHASFGNTWVERMWQGKILFVSILVPTLIVYLGKALRWGRASDYALCGAAAVAGVGLTSSAVFLMPGFLAVGIAAAVSLGQWRRGLPLLAPMAFVLILGLIWQDLSTTNSADARSLAASARPVAAVVEASSPMTVDIVEKVLGTGPYLIIGLAGALLGWIMIEQRHARVIAVWLLAVAVVAISPLGLAVLDLIGLSESIRWRMIWLVPVPALLGALAAGAAARIGRGPGIPLVGLVGAATVLAGLPIWSAENGVSLGPPSHKWPIDVQEDHARVASVARDGDVLGVPESTGAMVAALSGVYWSVNPRGSYTSSMDVQDGFCGLERSVVNQYARGLRTLDEEAVGSLERLGVTVLQFAEGVAPDRRSLAALGFEPTEQRDVLRRDPPNAASPCRTPTD